MVEDASGRCLRAATIGGRGRRGDLEAKGRARAAMRAIGGGVVGGFWATLAGKLW